MIPMALLLSPPPPTAILPWLYLLPFRFRHGNAPILDQLLPFVSRLMLIYYLVYAYRHFF